jgi:hypothetical protein
MELLNLLYSKDSDFKDAMILSINSMGDCVCTRNCIRGSVRILCRELSEEALLDT